MLTNTDPADLTDSELIETADGMRFWWNDDNPDTDQQEAYLALSRVLGPIDKLSPEGIWFAKWEQYVIQLEELVAEMSQRYEGKGQA